MGEPLAGTEAPWLGIIGLGEDGPTGLCPASRAALDAAEIVFGGPRHLALAGVGARGRAWPVPFDLAPLLACRGRRVVVLASGDPFWFGAGGSIARHLDSGEWRCWPAPSTFSLAAARLGWRIEETACLGLHAAPFATALPHLAPGARLICLLRDAAAASGFRDWLDAQGFGGSTLWLLEALGGPRERVRRLAAAMPPDAAPPLALAVEAAGAPGLAAVPGRPIDAFAHDGQITKPAIRAMTLAALAPRRGQMLWDLGAGSGSVAVEWCLAGGRAVAVEARADRIGNIEANIAAFGLAGQMAALRGRAAEVLADLPAPDAVFVGGGFDAALFARLQAAAPRARLVVNAVTLATEGLLIGLHAAHGGALTRIALESAAPLGRGSGWQPARPLLQWSTVL